jgi:hypothetical protein
MKRNLLSLSLLFALPACAAVAQSNEFIDSLLASKAATVGQVSYLVLVASDKLGEDADQAKAFEQLQSLGWAPKNAAVDDPIRLASYSYILMRAFDLKGGVMYSWLPSPRYAYRELASRQLIQGRSDPQEKVDGSAAVRILGRVLDVAEKAK